MPSERWGPREQARTERLWKLMDNRRQLEGFEAALPGIPETVLRDTILRMALTDRRALRHFQIEHLESHLPAQTQDSQVPSVDFDWWIREFEKHAHLAVQEHSVTPNLISQWCKQVLYEQCIDQELEKRIQSLAATLVPDSQWKNASN